MYSYIPVQKELYDINNVIDLFVKSVSKRLSKL